MALAPCGARRPYVSKIRVISGSVPPPSRAKLRAVNVRSVAAFRSVAVIVWPPRQLPVRVASDGALGAERGDLGPRIAYAHQHVLGVLTQTWRRRVDAGAVLGELEGGLGHGHRAVDSVDLRVLVQHASALEVRIGEGLGEPAHAPGGDV